MTENINTRGFKDGRHFVDDIFKCFVKEWCLSSYCLKYQKAAIGSDNGLVLNRRHDISWIKDDPVHMCLDFISNPMMKTIHQ